MLLLFLSGLFQTLQPSFSIAPSLTCYWLMCTFCHKMVTNRILPWLTSHPHFLLFLKHCVPGVPLQLYWNCSPPGDITIKPAILCSANIHLDTCNIWSHVPSCLNAFLPNFGTMVSSWFSLLKFLVGLDQCGSVGWTLSHKVKGRRFNSQSGHMPGFRVWSPVGAKGSWELFLSLTFSFPSPLPKNKYNLLNFRLFSALSPVACHFLLPAS